MGLQIALKNGRIVPVTDAQLSKLFWPRFQELPNGCLEWTGRQDQDYGRFRVCWDRKRAEIGIHRVAWIIAHGPIPPGMTVDHLCFNTLCGNIDHLRLLTLEENARNRRSYRPDQCPAGHPRTAENTYIRQGRGRTFHQCRPCQLEHQRRTWRKARIAA